jgi:hypothetical protein
MGAKVNERHKTGDSHVVEVTRKEWQAAVDSALRRLKLTWSQLEGQARTGEFSSREARALWAAVGRHGAQK